ncbi:MAG: VanZ family protein [Candidatus Nanohaloarchaea archaeon]|nr:VanZ family protein [Candidatus Nanohaloarchaea archaeon]
MMRVYSVKQTFFRVLLVLYTGIVLYFSLLPGMGEQAKEVIGLNLLFMHVGTYFVMAFLAAVAFPSSFERSRLRVAGTVFLLGLAIEFVQMLVPGRYFGVLDVLLNGVGASLVLLKPYVEGLIGSERGA